MDFATEIRSKQLIKSQDNCSCEMLGQIVGQTVGSIFCIAFLSWSSWSEAGIVDGLAGLINFWLDHWCFPVALSVAGRIDRAVGQPLANSWVFFDLGWFSIVSRDGIGISPHNRSGGPVA